MRKLLLLMFAGAVVFTVNAQEKNDMLFAPHNVNVPLNSEQELSQSEIQLLHRLSPATRLYAQGKAARATGCCGPYHAWYDLWNQNAAFSGGSYTPPAILNYCAVYPDSSIYDDYNGTNSFVGIHGMGQSFDPTDSGYYLPPYGNALLFGVTDDVTGALDVMYPAGQAYTIDSFALPVKYLRNNPVSTVVDSLIIEIAVTHYPVLAPGAVDSGAYALQYSAPSTSFYPVSYDEKPRFGTLRYSPGGAWDPPPYNTPVYINDCYFDSVFTQKQRYAIALTGSASDTDANGYIILTKTGGPRITMGLTTPLNIYSSRVHAVAFVSFKSGVAYPPGTHASVANLIHCFAGEPNGPGSPFRQSTSNLSLSPAYPGSYQAGVYADNNLRYLHTGAIDTGFYATGAGPHDILIPGFDFSKPGLSVPLVAWHIIWYVYIPSDVNQPGLKTISIVTPHPNPARDELNISFDLVQNGNVSISLINMLGQIIGTRTMTDVNSGNVIFGTADLPDGVYIYVAEANGKRTTGRIAVQH